VTKCYPGRGRGASGDRLPGREEQALCRPYLDAEIQLVDPLLLLPVGRLAIETILGKKAPLESVIGGEFERQGRWVIPLPHPSGASRWHQFPENRRLVRRALERLRSRLATLGIP
jgi:uracil-DNA glycosylase